MGRIAFRCFALAAALVFAGMAHAGHYAPVNGLKMYYEDDGHGRPLVMLHGGLCTIELCLGKLRAELATGRRIIAPELQGHGHTADIDRAMTMEQLTEDVAALLRRLDVRDADFFGFSIGGGIALRLALKYPELVHKVVVFGAQIDKDGLVPGTAEFLESAKAADFPPEFREAYAKVAPDPARFAALVPKVAKTVAMDTGLGRDRLKCIAAPVLVMVGDADMVRAEHAVEMYRLLPHANLAVLPRSTHFAPKDRPKWVAFMTRDFLDAPMPALAARDACPAR